MKAIKTFLILILTAIAISLLLAFSGSDTGGAAQSQEINYQAETLSSSTLPATVPEPASEDSPAIQILRDIIDLLSDIADICMEMLFTLWSGASESARCFLGLLITLNLIFSLIGLRSAIFRDVSRGRHIYME